MDSSTVGNSLIRVNTIIGFLAAEDVRNKFDNTRDTSGTADQYDFMDIQLVDLGVAEVLLNRSRVLRNRSWQSSSKRARVRDVKVDTFKGRIDFDGCLGSR